MRLMSDLNKSFEAISVTSDSHLTITLSTMATPRRRTEQKINWTTETRIGLLAAALLTGSQWNDARDLWWQEFSNHAPGHSRNGRLKACLCSQHAMIKRPAGANTWGQIGRTLQELELQAPDLVQRLRAASVALGYGQAEAHLRPPHLSTEPVSATASAVIDRAPPTTSVEATVLQNQTANLSRRTVAPAGLRTDSMFSVFSGTPISEPPGSHKRSSTTAPSSPLPLPQEPGSSIPATPRTTAPQYPRRPSGQNTDEYLNQIRSMDHGALREVPFDLAHPPLPVLFYRYYNTANTHVGNYPNGRGFISGLYNGPTIHQGFGNPLDSSEAFLFHLIEVHVNQRKHPPTPFVSVSTNLHWVVTTAAMKHHNGENMRISIIDATAAAGPDRSRAYHVQAYYDQLRERAAFDDFAKMMYRGKYEFLIWAHIPRSAIVGDFSYAEMREFCEGHIHMRNLFRLPILEIPRQGGSDQIRARWREDPADLLLPSTIPALIEMMLWLFCRSPTSNISLNDAVTKLVSDIVGGWVIRPSRALNRQEWIAIAQGFSTCLHTKLQIASSPQSIHTLAKAFLFGFISGLADPHWFYDQTQRSALQRAMQQFGLRQPDELLCGPDNVMVAGIRSLIDATPPRPSRSRSRVNNPSTPRSSTTRPSDVIPETPTMTTNERGRAQIREAVMQTPTSEHRLQPPMLTPTPTPGPHQSLEDADDPMDINMGVDH